MLPHLLGGLFAAVQPTPGENVLLPQAGPLPGSWEPPPQVGGPVSEVVEAKLQPRLPSRVGLCGAGSALPGGRRPWVGQAAGSNPIWAARFLGLTLTSQRLSWSSL